MNQSQYILYNILLACQIHVQTHAADSNVWRLSSNTYESVEPLSVAVMTGIATCALQQWILITKDPFHDIQILQTEKDALVVQLK